MTDHRRNLGALGEDLARRHLTARGFEVLDSNYRTRYGELDVVASDGSCLVFCEVKTRIESPATSALGPLASVGPRKQRRVRMMARQWLADRAAESSRRPAGLRFDAIGITLGRDGRLVALDHVEDAF